MDLQNREHYHARVYGFDRRRELAARMLADAESIGPVDSTVTVFRSNSQCTVKKEGPLVVDDADGKLLFGFVGLLVEHRWGESVLVAVGVSGALRAILRGNRCEPIAVQYVDREADRGRSARPVGGNGKFNWWVIRDFVCVFAVAAMVGIDAAPVWFDFRVYRSGDVVRCGRGVLVYRKR